MNTLATIKSVAIDTNIFEGILNPEMNTDSHINAVLECLRESKVFLIVDKQGRIAGEYDERLCRTIQNSKDVGSVGYILDYWINVCPRLYVEVKLRDELMTQIKKVVHESGETVDRIFVYVAFREGKTLITNDRMHIVDGPTKKKGARRAELMKIPKKFKKQYPNVRNACILTSCEAYSKFSARLAGDTPTDEAET